MVLGRCLSATGEVVLRGENKRALYGSSESLILLRCTSCGRDGLWAQHILDALCGEGSATATDLLKAITSVVNLWSAGRCPPILAEFVAYALLTPLLKLDNEIWPFTVGTIWRRLVFKVAMKDSEEVARVFDIIKVSGPSLGLEFNIKKTEIFWPSCNGVKRREGLFLVDIQRPSLGVKLLGGVVSRNTYFISGMAMRRATNAVNLMSLLPQLHNPQSELLLLRSCMGIFKLFIGLRTCQPVHMEEATLFFDKGLRGSIENIVVCGGLFFGDLQWRLASLPIHLGGVVLGKSSFFLCFCGIEGPILGVTRPHLTRHCFTNKDTAPSKAQQTLASALFSEMVKDMKAHFDMTVRHKAVFECLRAPHAQDFLLAIPIDDGAGQICHQVDMRPIATLDMPLVAVDGWTGQNADIKDGVSVK
ncbi:hypothetical protein Tco_1210457 [Tanacetum coccineum]